MWVLIDIFSNERLGEGFPSQAKLAKFMKLNPRTLNKAVKEGRNVFAFCGKGVRVVEQKVARFSVHESPSGPPLKSFEKAAEVAQWLGVSRQAVYAAFDTFCNYTERKIKKNGKEWFLKKVFEDPLTNPWKKEAKPQKALNSKRKFPKKRNKISRTTSFSQHSFSQTSSPTANESGFCSTPTAGRRKRTSPKNRAGSREQLFAD